ncbi:MAG TPA: hypothetical protein IAB24_05225 [Candidatus Copromonas avistercoris]|nr:hypothetical protein [Candidatus Copromonas avistercoris]
MGKFRNVFFGGYQKAEVDEYVEGLLSELERAKSGEGKEGAQKEKELEEAKANLQREQEEKNQLLKQLSEMKAKLESSQTDKNKELREVKEQLNEYQNKYSYDVFADMLSSAKKDADQLINSARENAEQLTSTAKENAEQILNEARENADRITMDAQVDARIYRQKVEKELKAQEEENGKKFMVAKYRLMEYLEALNRSQSQLIKTYNELGEIVKKMPVQMEDALETQKGDPLEKTPEDNE